MAENRMTIRKITPAIYYVEYKERFSMARALMRLSEYYDSPHFKGKIFGSEELIKWYISNSKKGKETGKFTYYDDWEGFNFPSEILEPFYHGKFDPLNTEEKELLESFREKIEAGEKFYIIATALDIFTKEVFQHELAHAFFYMNSSYKSQALDILGELSNSNLKILRDYVNSIHGIGYAEERITDEIHAYLITYDDVKAEGLDYPEFRKVHEKLISLLNRFYETEGNGEFSPYFNSTI
ncbi:MAG: hypothetical protein Q8Q31_03830 [Nanoarchaeota archaeon]|nr:hypothetical protein [Nanoarchaeota archaeon]